MEKGKDFKETQLPKQFKTYISRDGSCSSLTPKSAECTDLSVKVMLNNPIQEEWKDVYSRVGIYGTRCKAYRGTENKDVKYCDFNWDYFYNVHVTIVGVLYNFAIPFLPYNEKILESEEPEEGFIFESKSNIRDRETPINANAIKLTIDQKASRC